jgi:hypothetical protein
MGSQAKEDFIVKIGEDRIRIFWRAGFLSLVVARTTQDAGCCSAPLFKVFIRREIAT